MQGEYLYYTTHTRPHDSNNLLTILLGGSMYKKLYLSLLALMLVLFSQCSVDYSVPVSELESLQKGGVETTVYGNNLSFPVIWSDGATKVLRGTYGVPNFTGKYLTVDGIYWYLQQDEFNVWQAENLLVNAATGPQVVVDSVDWGDNLESKDWSLTSVIRTEVVLFKNLNTPEWPSMLGFAMQLLYGKGTSEMWGTNTATYQSTKSTVYSGCARLTIQKMVQPKGTAQNAVWNPALGKWEGQDAGTVLFNGGVWEAADGPGYYSAEINIPGKVIYGYNWKTSDLNAGAGTYRLTFSFDGMNGAGHPSIALNTFFREGATAIIPTKGTGGITALDYANNLTYIDVNLKTSGR
jgi:hypothetical protein